MKVKLAYGKNGLIVDLPSKDIDIIEPSFVEGIKDEGSAILQALQNPVASPPLRQLADSDASVLLARSVSSIRSMNCPPLARAKHMLNSAT